MRLQEMTAGCTTGARFCVRAAWYKLHDKVIALYIAPLLSLFHLLQNPFELILRWSLSKSESVHARMRVHHILFEHYYWRIVKLTIYTNI